MNRYYIISLESKLTLNCDRLLVAYIALVENVLRWILLNTYILTVITLILRLSTTIVISGVSQVNTVQVLLFRPPLLLFLLLVPLFLFLFSFASSFMDNACFFFFSNTFFLVVDENIYISFTDLYYFPMIWFDLLL